MEGGGQGSKISSKVAKPGVIFTFSPFHVINLRSFEELPQLPQRIMKLNIKQKKSKLLRPKTSLFLTVERWKSLVFFRDNSQSSKFALS